MCFGSSRRRLKEDDLEEALGGFVECTAQLRGPHQNKIATDTKSFSCNKYLQFCESNRQTPRWQDRHEAEVLGPARPEMVQACLRRVQREQKEQGEQREDQLARADDGRGHHVAQPQRDLFFLGFWPHNFPSRKCLYY